MKSKNIRNIFTAIGGVSLLTLATSHAVDSNWNAQAGNWSLSSNWTAGVPGGVSSIVNFTNDITGSRTVTIDTTDRTVGSLTIGDFNNNNAFTLAASGGGDLIFDNGTSNAMLIENGSVNDIISAPVTLNSLLEISNTGNLTLSGKITGMQGITKNGTGNIYLANSSNDYSGGFILNTGIVYVNNGNAFGTSTLTINGGRIDPTSSIGGTGTTITTTNANIWNASWTIGRGSTANSTWNNNGDVTLGANVSVATANNATFLNLGGIIGETGGARSLTFTGNFAESRFTLSNANTYSGGTTLSTTATLNINNASAIGTGPLTFTSGRIDNTSGSAITLSTNNAVNANTNIAFLGANDLNLGSGTVTIDGNRTFTVNNRVLTIGAVAQSGSNRQLIKNGVGTLALSGINTYQGATTVSAGNLRVNGSTHTSSAFTVASGATLSGNGTVGGTLALAGTVAPGQGVTDFQTLNVRSTTLNTGAAFQFNLPSSGSESDKLVVNGALTKGTGITFNFDFMGSTAVTGTVFTLISHTSIAGGLAASNFSFSNYGSGAESGTTGFTLTGSSLTWTAVPEASNLLIGGLLGLGMMARRRKQA